MQTQDTWDFSSPPPPPKRSTFVTVVAWIFIALAGLSVFSCLFEAAVLATVFPPEAMYDLMAQTVDMEQVPVWFRFMYTHLMGFMLAALAMSLFLLVSSIGLLRRRNWGRIAFIAFLVFGIVWQVSSVFWIRAMFSSMLLPPNVPEAQVQSMKAVMQVMRTVGTVFSVVVVLALAVLFAWIIKRLTSAKVRAEFGA